MTPMISQPRKFASAVLASALIVSAAFTTACTPEQKTMLITSVGAAGGAILGKKVGGTAGAVAGGLLGGFAGYLIADYLTTQEQQDYQNTLASSMERTNDGSGSTIVWTNEAGDKQVVTEYSHSKPIQLAAAQGFGNVRVNQQVVAALPANSFCRSSKADIIVNGKDVGDDEGIYCRNADGDYVRVDTAVA